MPRIEDLAAALRELDIWLAIEAEADAAFMADV